MLPNRFFQHAQTLVRTGGWVQTSLLAQSCAKNVLRLKFLSRRSRIVVIALMERLGDLVAAEPIIRQVRDNHPTALLVFCTTKRYQEIVANHPAVDAVITVRNYSEWRTLIRLFPFGKIYDLHPARFPCHVFRQHWRKRYGDPKVTMDNYYYFPGGLQGAFSRAGGIAFEPGTPRVTITARARKKIDSLRMPNAFCVAHTRSADPRRDWRGCHWDRLSRELNLPIVEVGKLSTIAQALSLAGKLSILETAEVIRRAKLFIGVDSGPAHLANAVQTPGVILLGSFLNFQKYDPYNGYYARGGAIHVRVNGPAREIPYSFVWNAVQELQRDSKERCED